MGIFDRLVGVLSGRKNEEPREEAKKDVLKKAVADEISVASIVAEIRESGLAVEKSVEETPVTTDSVVVEKCVPAKSKKSGVQFTARPLSLRLNTFGLTIEDVPVVVKGSGKKSYWVDPVELSCSCPEFTEARAGYEPDDVRRVCKHLSQTLQPMLAEVKGEEAILHLLSSLEEKSFQRYSIAIEVELQQPPEDGPRCFYLFQEEGREWVDILLLEGENRGCYGFHLGKKRWAKKNNPFPYAHKATYSRAMKQALQQAAESIS